MSYILDALRKADAQRRAGTTPPLHSVWDTPTFADPPPRQRQILVSVLLAVSALAAGAALTWLMLRPSTPEQTARVTARVPDAAAGSAPQPAAYPITADATTAATTATLPAAPPQGDDSDALDPPRAEPASRSSNAEPGLPLPPKPKAEPVPEPRASKAESTPPVLTNPVAAANPRPPTPTPAPAATETSGYRSLPALQDLPAASRQAIPPLTLGGYIYSSKQAERSILINNRLRQEGDEIAPGLRLESMTPEGLILNFRGQRFRQNY